MLIKVLVENTSISDEFVNEHGLSLYIESKDSKTLFDLGASSLFYENAKKLDIDIKDIDYTIISHGHYDHGGGLGEFLRQNNKAKIYIREEAFNEHLATRSNERIEYIGLDNKLKTKQQIIFTDDYYEISSGIKSFSNVKQNYPKPLSNKNLYQNKKGKMLKDEFNHEQNLIIEEDGRSFLIIGCAHNGIINIIEHFYLLRGYMPDYVIGGFHLSSRSAISESKEDIKKIGNYLVDTKAQYYTCHCTGMEAYNELKKIMGDKIKYLSCGSTIII